MAYQVLLWSESWALNDVVIEASYQMRPIIVPIFVGGIVPLVSRHHCVCPEMIIIPIRGVLSRISSASDM